MPDTPDVEDLLDQITSARKSDIQGQIVAKRAAHFRSSGIDASRITSDTIEAFDQDWQDIETRMMIVPGKEVLKQLPVFLQKDYGITLTDNRILDAYKTDEIPDDMIDLLQKLEEFRLGEITVEDNRPKA